MALCLCTNNSEFYVFRGTTAEIDQHNQPCVLVVAINDGKLFNNCHYRFVIPELYVLSLYAVYMLLLFFE